VDVECAWEFGGLQVLGFVCSSSLKGVVDARVVVVGFSVVVVVVFVVGVSVVVASVVVVTVVVLGFCVVVVVVVVVAGAAVVLKLPDTSFPNGSQTGVP